MPHRSPQLTASIMSSAPVVDITFDFRLDTPPGRDPDQHSPTLRRYHQLLWSKPLPTGGVFTLASAPRCYLQHRSEHGEFFLASDSVIPTFVGHTRLAALLSQIPAEELEQFQTLSYTMGGMMVFPGNTIDRKPTINGARGMNGKIRDRFDLTVECIRRFYQGGTSPLAATLDRYHDFFALFDDFRGYVDFFLLQDLVTDDYSETRAFLPFGDFDRPAVPTTPEAYSSYRADAEAFINARNRRIVESSHNAHL